MTYQSMIDDIRHASFHFTDDGVYINYEASLDNGDELPARKYFEDVT